MKKVMAVLGLSTVLFLTGCGSGYRDGHDYGGDLNVTQVVIDGKVTTCVVYDDSSYNQGGVSCDFD